MALSYECPYCHSNLDHGEPCDCRKNVPPEETTAPPEPEMMHQPFRMPHCKDCGKKFIDIEIYVEEAARKGLTIRDFLRSDPCYNPHAYLFLCPDCWNAAGQPTEMVKPVIRCKGCGRRPEEIEDCVSDAMEAGMPADEFICGDSTYNPVYGLFCCNDCWQEAGYPQGPVQPDEFPETGLVPYGPQGLAIVEADEADVPEETVPIDTIHPDVLNAPAGNDEEAKLFTCEHCGQTSLNNKCKCKQAKLARTRQSVEKIIARMSLFGGEPEEFAGDAIFELLVHAASVI
ncbi:MAG: hypothetical protein LBI31_04720, partial [Zoogloeaceae bacterium]|nr:hypothetical protein [Zoogloeaceae bacterium]